VYRLRRLYQALSGNSNIPDAGKEPKLTVDAHETIHISSFIVRCLPEKLQQVMSAVGALPGVEIHAHDPCGKFVALLELDSEKALVETITTIELMKGIVNTSMVYHHVE
jgi:nitrate reductase NapD